LTREDDGEEDEEDELSVDPKRRKTMDLYMKEREGKPNADCQSRSPMPSTSAEPSSSPWGQARPTGASEADGGKRDRWGQARLVGAGEANGGRKPPGQIPSQQLWLKLWLRLWLVLAFGLTLELELILLAQGQGFGHLPQTLPSAKLIAPASSCSKGLAPTSRRSLPTR